MAKTAACSNDELIYVAYCFTNKINSKKYVGITSNMNRRFKQHKSGRNRCPVFLSAIKKYGFENFEFAIIEKNLTCEEAKLLEKKFIKNFNSMVPNGYNRTEGGDASVKHSEESKNKISESNKNYLLNNPHVRIGTKHSEETKKLLSELALKRTNRPRGVDHWRHGKKHGESTIEKMKIRKSLGSNPFAKKVIDLNTNVIYSCINEAKQVYGVSHSMISMICSGKRKSSKYNFMYLKDYEKERSISIDR
jgi:group I intron endonuclease